MAQKAPLAELAAQPAGQQSQQQYFAEDGRGVIGHIDPQAVGGEKPVPVVLAEPVGNGQIDFRGADKQCGKAEGQQPDQAGFSQFCVH